MVVPVPWSPPLLVRLNSANDAHVGSVFGVSEGGQHITKPTIGNGMTTFTGVPVSGSISMAYLGGGPS